MPQRYRNIIADKFIRTILVCFVLSGIGLAGCNYKKADSDVESVISKPNIILIFTDDQGYGDLGCFGSPNIRTPNIDRMASEGIRLTSFYAAVFCGPSRAQLMTGCYHARVNHSYNELPGAETGLHPEEITIAELLREEGYSTMHIGKWHLGDDPGFLPTRQGFDHFWGFPYSHDMWPYHCRTIATDLDDSLLINEIRERAERIGYTVGGAWDFPPLPLIQDEEVIEYSPDQSQMTTRYTDKALEFIEDNSRQPFFLYLAHTMPHTPLFVSAEFDGKSERGLYGDAIMEIDWSCGQIFTKLKELGIDERTMVIFSSDNGPTPRYGTDGGSAGPFRGGKGSVYEGGSRVPAIIRWPGMIPSGVSSNVITGTMDLLPTIAEVAGAALPANRIIDGEDLLPLLSGETVDSPHEFFHYFGGSRPDKPANYTAIRNGKWKLLVKRKPTGELEPFELYDLGSDPSEMHDRLEQYPEIADPLVNEAQLFLNELEANRRPIGRL